MLNEQRSMFKGQGKKEKPAPVFTSAGKISFQNTFY